MADISAILSMSPILICCAPPLFISISSIVPSINCGILVNVSFLLGTMAQQKSCKLGTHDVSMAISLYF